MKIGSHYSIVDHNLRNRTSYQREDLAPHSILSAKLLKISALKGWERLFVKTLATSTNPGRKQIEKLEAIALRLGHGGEP
jgi:hypothetical protein